MDKKRIKIGRIDYINVDPIYFNFDNKKNDLSAIAKPPSILNKMLESGDLDISPVSSAAYARNHNEWLILPDLSVSCFGNVMSVIFVSDVDIKKLDKAEVIVSNESRTAADLIRLFFYSQNIRPVFIKENVKKALKKEKKAALIIGDAALRYDWKSLFKHVWDLGDLWQHMTHMPFVFALWAVRKNFAEKNPEAVSYIQKEFYLSKREGLKNIKSIIKSSAEKLNINAETCERYFNCLDFDLKERQINGLTTFFDGLYQQAIIKEKVELNFFKNIIETK